VRRLSPALLLLLLLAHAVPGSAEAPSTTLPPLLSLKDQAALRDQRLAERLDRLAGELMRQHGVDMWILVAREYLDDPVMATMLNATSFTARRRTIILFHDRGPDKGVERLTVSRYGLGGLFDAAWVPEEEPDQWKRLASLVAERDPKRIAINVSPESAFADGLTSSQHQALVGALPEPYRNRLVPAGQLAIDWLATRTPAEVEDYRTVMQVAHAIIAEGLSEKAVTPGKTTAADLQWWYRTRISELGLEPWFHPSVALFREGETSELGGDAVIRPGDMIWTDFGIRYLGLATDTQTLAYVLKPGERGAPEGLKAGLGEANRMADLLLAELQSGRSGNDVLLSARAAAQAKGIDATLYSHPIGTHGHGAGPAIGFWDDQAPGPRGAGPIRPMTAWSIEFAVTRAVPEWGGQKVPFRFERNIFFDGATPRWIDGRQRDFYLIPSP
jgi:Xaa-Pro aminopeptidase